MQQIYLYLNKLITTLSIHIRLQNYLDMLSISPSVSTPHTTHCLRTHTPITETVQPQIQRSRRNVHFAHMDTIIPYNIPSSWESSVSDLYIASKERQISSLTAIQEAADRDRFRRRIAVIEKILNPILHDDHRVRVYAHIKTCTDRTCV